MIAVATLAQKNISFGLWDLISNVQMFHDPLYNGAVDIDVCQFLNQFLFHIQQRQHVSLVPHCYVLPSLCSLSLLHRRICPWLHLCPGVPVLIRGIKGRLEDKDSLPG